MRRAILIAGPTAGGKSALALEKARETGGVIVNADALQIYAGLEILTARPGAGEGAEAPHLLYGMAAPETRFSTGDWARAVQSLLREEERPMIFVGGTGLYFEALTKGFAEVPAVSAAAVTAAAAEIDGLDLGGRAALIAARDPKIAARLKVPDPQRVTRALAVLNATGRSLAEFQDAPTRPLLDGWKIERLVLDPPRVDLNIRIAVRFEAMLAGGAIEEAEAFLALGLDPNLPAMKAIGLREIGAWLAGQASRADMVERAVIATRQYAKRQRTWLRGRMADWDWRG